MLTGVARAAVSRCSYALSTLPFSCVSQRCVASITSHQAFHSPPARAMSGTAGTDGGKREEGSEPLRIYFAASIRGTCVEASVGPCVLLRFRTYL